MRIVNSSTLSGSHRKSSRNGWARSGRWSRRLSVCSNCQRTFRNRSSRANLSFSHGRALLMTDDPAIQKTVANNVVARGMSVRETERTVKRLASDPSQTGAKKSTAGRRVDANVKSPRQN